MHLQGLLHRASEGNDRFTTTSDHSKGVWPDMDFGVDGLIGIYGCAGGYGTLRDRLAARGIGDGVFCFDNKSR